MGGSTHLEMSSYLTQLYGIVVRAPDFGPRGPRFES
jgi:hypothetical protein